MFVTILNFYPSLKFGDKVSSPNLEVRVEGAMTFGHNDTHNNDIQHDDIQHNSKLKMTLGIMAERCYAVSFMLSVTYAECHI
jgi:hypothetical protein